MRKTKVEKLQSIYRRLYKKWSLAVRGKANHLCEMCGEKAIKLDAHHIVNRRTKNSALKWDVRNGVCCCPSCHKFGEQSFHINPLVALEKFKAIRGNDYKYLLEEFYKRINLSDRDMLEEIEGEL